MAIATTAGTIAQASGLAAFGQSYAPRRTLLEPPRIIPGRGALGALSNAYLTVNYNTTTLRQVPP